MPFNPSVRPLSIEERFALAQAKNTPAKSADLQVPEPKRGDQIFENDPDSPQSFDDFTGQTLAKDQFTGAIALYHSKDKFPGHMLLSSGLPGIGKSALSRIIAKELDFPYIETQGEVSKREAIAICEKLTNAFNPAHPGGILFLDEVHQIFSRSKEAGEWLLSLMQDKVILSADGERKFPNILIIAATTDGATIPNAVLSRFSWTPLLKPYTEKEAASIAERYADPEFEMTPTDFEHIAQVSSGNPRTIKKLMEKIEVQVALDQWDYLPDSDNSEHDLSNVLIWAGLDQFGLTINARKIYMILFNKGAFGGQGYGLNNIAAELGETVYPMDDENILKSKGFLTVSAAGRSLTEYGVSFFKNITIDWI